ncbi:MAG: (Fe-S)-binding protein [Bacteroidales bacterium]
MDKIIIFPFLAGFTYLMVILVIRGVRWINGLSRLDKLRLFKAIPSRRTLASLKEVFMEGLIHRKIFLKNPILGYMHMSLAFGWFLLIAVGHIEAMVAGRTFAVSIYKPVFFRFFERSNDFFLSGLFTFVMDLLLLFVLTGLGLAIIKRFRKRLFGLRKTTRLKTGDLIALTSLWLIFPLRLLAESNAAALYGNGGFMTTFTGNAIGGVLKPEIFNLPLWFAYSFTLGFFFVALPNSRYMHIPSEILLIFLRNAGIRLKKHNNTFTEVQVYSCSRCGICLDRCQLSVAGIDDSQSVYMLKSIRNKRLGDEQLFNCLMCGKCQTDCPVGIDTIDLRITQRIESTLQYNSSYDYLETSPAHRADMIYFAGCMTHLTPGIIASMKTIFKTVGDDVWFMDEEKAPCCGRPLMLAGQYNAASKLIKNNSRQILDSGARTLVVSCPICYKVFKEDYSLGNVEVLFHADYIMRLLNRKTLLLTQSDKRFLYHDPCELGRGMGMYDIPREVLNTIGQVVSIKNEKEKAHCCGGSLGNLKITQKERNILRDQALLEYRSCQPDFLVTACPKCKKTFAGGRQLVVRDISEVVADVLHDNDTSYLENMAHLQPSGFAELLQG